MDAIFCYHIVLMFFATVGFALLWVGFATPGWLVLTYQEAEAAREYTVSSLNRSLFYDVVCPQELGDCKTFATDDTDTEVADLGFVSIFIYPDYSSHYAWTKLMIADKEEWTMWQVLYTISVVAGLIGFILVLLLVCCLFSPFAYRVVATCGFVAWLIPGILVWVPVGMMADMHLKVGDMEGYTLHDATLHVPYSVVIAAIGALLALVVAVMLLWLTGICGRRRDDKSESESQTPTEVFSDRTKTYFDDRDRIVYNQYPPERQVYYRDRTPEPYNTRTITDEDVVTENPYYKGAYPSYGPYLGPTHWYDNSNTMQGGM